jgi:hypothetical protein
MVTREGIAGTLSSIMLEKLNFLCRTANRHTGHNKRECVYQQTDLTTGRPAQNEATFTQ